MWLFSITKHLTILEWKYQVFQMALYKLSASLWHNRHWHDRAHCQNRFWHNEMLSIHNGHKHDAGLFLIWQLASTRYIHMSEIKILVREEKPQTRTNKQTLPACTSAKQHTCTCIWIKLLSTTISSDHDSFEGDL